MNKKASPLKIIMFGPARSVKGGISTVVNGYYEAGLNKKIKLKYVETMHDKNNIAKLCYFIQAWFFACFHLRQYDIAHIHMSMRASFYRKYLLALLCRIVGIPYIVHLHGSEFEAFYHKESGKIVKNMIRKTFEKAGLVIALSKSWEEAIVEMAPKAEVKVIYNSVKLHKQVKGINHRLLFLGRIGERKGVFDLLRAVKELAKKYEDIHLYIGGDGEVERLSHEIKALDIGKYVTYVGWVRGRKKEKLIQNCAIYVLPSYNEGLPMSVLEAMSFGRVAVTSKVGGLPELIDDSDNGYLVKPGDVAAICNCIDRLYLDVEKYEKVSDKGYKTIENQFNIDRVINELVEIYTKMQ